MGLQEKLLSPKMQKNELLMVTTTMHSALPTGKLIPSS